VACSTLHLFIVAQYIAIMSDATSKIMWGEIDRAMVISYSLHVCTGSIWYSFVQQGKCDIQDVGIMSTHTHNDMYLSNLFSVFKRLPLISWCA